MALCDDTDLKVLAETCRELLQKVRVLTEVLDARVLRGLGVLVMCVGDVSLLLARENILEIDLLALAVLDDLLLFLRGEIRMEEAEERNLRNEFVVARLNHVLQFLHCTFLLAIAENLLEETIDGVLELESLLRLGHLLRRLAEAHNLVVCERRRQLLKFLVLLRRTLEDLCPRLRNRRVLSFHFGSVDTQMMSVLVWMAVRGVQFFLL